MQDRFREMVESLDSPLKQLTSMPARQRLGLEKTMPSSGVYRFSEGDTRRYVGRSDRLRDRIMEHIGSGESLVLRLAREDTGHFANYKTEKSPGSLKKNPEFRAAVERARARVAGFDIRYVECADPTRQALLEIYCAIALGTTYNDFANH